MRDWYRSLAKSGQSRFYEPSDWQTAKLCAEIMSRELYSEDGVKAATLKVFESMSRSLMTTEAERRRVRVELERVVQDEGDHADELRASADHYLKIIDGDGGGLVD